MSWQSYESAAKRGPIPITLKVVFTFIILSVILGPIGFVMGWFGEAKQVLLEQVGPRELLRKYEWFKDASAQLDAKRASLNVLTGRIDGMKKDYADTPRGQWPRDDRQQQALWESERDGLAMSYNNLAAEYNAAMSKINYAFCNVGSLPQGATQALPREYRDYNYGDKP